MIRLFGRNGDRRLSRFLKKSSLPPIETWLHRVLEGLEDWASLAHAPQPQLPLIHLYRKADSATRQNLEFATVNNLKKLAYGGDGWTTEGAIELLLLADPFLLNSSRQNEIVCALLSMLDQVQQERRDMKLGRFTLQALLAIDYRLEPQALFDISDALGESVDSLVVEGLARTSLRSLGAWLSLRLPDREIERCFVNLIPFLLQQEGADAVVQLSLDLKLVLSPEAQHELKSDLNSVSVNLNWAEPAHDEIITDLVKSIISFLEVSRNSFAFPTTMVSAYGESMRVLGEYLSSRAGPQQHGSRIGLLDLYTQCLLLGLSREGFADVAYPVLARHAGVPELMEVSEYLVRSQGITGSKLLQMLRPVYSSAEAKELIAKVLQEVGRKEGQAVPATPPEHLAEILARRFGFHEQEQEVIDLLEAVDKEMGDDGESWVEGLLEAAR